MWEAAQYEHIPPTDIMYPDWDAMLASYEPVPTPPLPSRHVQKPLVKRSAQRISYIANIPDEDERPLCFYCEKRFTPQRINQIYCDTTHERTLNLKRKEALVAVLVSLFEKRGCCALRGDLASVARKCIAVAYEVILKAVKALGWYYDKLKKTWKLKTKPR